LFFTCPGAAVDLYPHAGGARVVTVGQETDPLGHKRVIQLLDNGQPRVAVARQNLIHHPCHGVFHLLIYFLLRENKVTDGRTDRYTWWELAFL
jgi:hypothetical protein